MNLNLITRRALLALALLSAAGCGSSSGGSGSSSTSSSGASTAGASGGGGEKKMTIAMLPKQKGIPYFTSCSEGAQKAADELGDVELIYDGPTDGTPEKAAEIIEKWSLRGVDAIAVSPNDPQVLKPAMEAARAKGIKMLTWDADGDKAAREWFVNQATSQQIGAALVDAMAKDSGGAGKFAIVTATLTAANQNEWIKAMREQLKKYPKMQLVEVKPCNDNQTLAFSVAQDLMKAYPDLKGIWGISSVAFPGAAEAVKQSGKSGKVFVCGLSTPNNMKAYVKDNTVRSVVLWNTQDLGYLTVQAAHALVRGELKSGASTFKAGKLGEKKIAGDNILLGDILVFNKQNIDKYNF